MTQTKEEKVHDVFQSISGNYDKMNAIISFQLHRAWRRDTGRRMQVFKGAHALDLCCGTADWTIQLAKAAGPEGYVCGLDFSENMLDIGRKKTAAIPALELIQGNAMELPFDDEAFDFVTIGFGLRNVPDYDTVLAEMYRVLKPGGTAVCLETSQPEKPLISGAYWLYFSKVMPVFGRLFAGKYDEYSWLQESTKHFPSKQKLKQMFRNAGFSSVDVRSYSGGTAASHFAYKAERGAEHEKA
ncbi:demethylmenaquinone methyltransferase [Bacillus daqingensis]|uniref:Demethylmenaquinone methyltransferase n=1 Tax=Bacillus daqingensis TaxID=872396 RepID=A0ABV9NV10_9BACI